MSAVRKEYKRVTTKSVVEMKANGEKISMLTAYDYTFAKLLDSAGIDVLLVGDSASNVMAGHETTLPITLDQMIYHASSVIRGVTRALIVVDLPFGTYQSDPKKASETCHSAVDQKNFVISMYKGCITAPSSRNGIYSFGKFISVSFFNLIFQIISSKPQF